MKLTRRDWIKIFGSSGAMLYVGGCTKIQDTLDYFTEHTLAMENILNQRDENIPWTNKIEIWKNTTCMLCDSRCGLSSRVVDTNLVHIKGNINHPVNRGGICPLGVTGLQYQYSVDRIKSPRKRSGERGSNRWESINIIKAIDTVDSILKEVSGGKDSVIFISDEKDSGTALLMKYFLKSLNSSTIISQNYKKGLIDSSLNTLNIMSEPIYDLENSDFVLSFGYDFLSYNDNFMYFQKAYPAFRSNSTKRGRHIQVESKFSLTAGKSDWWIPITPLTEHLLAQAIAYIIVKEDLIDKRFIRDFTKGYSKLKRELIKTTDLEIISRHTTVPVSDIVKIARELSESKRPVCMIGPQVYFTEDPTERIKSINLLNFLLGRFETKGGMLLKESQITEIIEKELFNKERFEVTRSSFDNITKERDFFKDKVVFITQDHPFKFAGLNKKLVSSLKQARFICYFGQYLDEISSVCDLILPSSSFLERDDISLASNGYKIPVISKINPIITGVYETLDLSDFMYKRIKRMKGFKGISSYKDFIKKIQSVIFSMRRGEIFTTHTDTSSVVEMLEGQGFWISNYKDESEFISDFDKYGSWWDPMYNYGEFGAKIGTRDGRIDLAGISLKKEIKADRNDKYDLRLIPILSEYIGMDGSGSDMPWIIEITGTRVHEKWTLWAEINPKTAARYHIKDGAMVRIRSKNGSIKAKAKYFEGCMPDCVNILFGAGTNSFGQWAKELDANIHALFDKDDLFGQDIPVLYSTRVRIEKV